MPVPRKRRQKGLRVSNFTLLLVVFKWHHGSEGIKLVLALFVILAKMNKLGCCACVGWGWCEVEFMFLMVTHIYIYMRWELPWATRVFATFLWLLSSTSWLPCLLMLHRCSGSCSVLDCWISLVLLLPGVITWRVYIYIYWYWYIYIYTLDFLESLGFVCVCVCCVSLLSY